MLLCKRASVHASGHQCLIPRRSDYCVSPDRANTPHGNQSANPELQAKTAYSLQGDAAANRTYSRAYIRGDVPHFREDHTHWLHLLLRFRYVVLVDTQCICPEPSLVYRAE